MCLPEKTDYKEINCRICSDFIENIKMIKAIFFDLDGVLVDEKINQLKP